MAEVPLTDVLGVGATQDATTVTIQKSSLPGLTPAANNTAEAIFAGILLRAKAGLPQSSFDTNIDQSIYIAAGFPGFTIRGTDNTSYRVDSLTVSLAKIDTSAIIDPDDY